MSFVSKLSGQLEDIAKLAGKPKRKGALVFVYLPFLIFIPNSSKQKKTYAFLSARVSKPLPALINRLILTIVGILTMRQEKIQVIGSAKQTAM